MGLAEQTKVIVKFLKANGKFGRPCLMLWLKAYLFSVYLCSGKSRHAIHALEIDRGVRTDNGRHEVVKRNTNE